MTRCSCCDWSPNGPQSDYNKGLAANGRKTHLILDKFTGDTICNICALVVALDLAAERRNEATPLEKEKTNERH